MQILPYVIGAVAFFILGFGIYVHTLPPVVRINATTDPMVAMRQMDSGNTFEEATMTEMGNVGEQQDPDIINLDGDGL